MKNDFTARRLFYQILKPRQFAVNCGNFFLRVIGQPFIPIRQIQRVAQFEYQSRASINIRLTFSFPKQFAKQTHNILEQ